MLLWGLIEDRADEGADQANSNAQSSPVPLFSCRWGGIENLVQLAGFGFSQQL
jgi:hypothetical protein